MSAEARYPRLATDGMYIGVRVIPDAALLAAWDLDVYILRNRRLSIGPAVSVALLGDGDMRMGQRRQELLLVGDARLKIQLNSPGGRWRPHAILGGGFSYFRVPSQTVTLIEATEETEAVEAEFPTDNGFGGILTAGLGGDVFINRFLGVTFFGVAHFDVSSDTPLPLAWLEMAVGIRFGL